MDVRHELTTRARQNRRARDSNKGKADWGNYQCWWLSFLEVARASGKLNDIFKPTGLLGAYYAQNAIPADDGIVPDGLRTLPKCQGMIRVGTVNEDADWTDLKNNLVYGPEWQRMIMFYLLDPANKFDWKMPNDTANSSDRPKELHRLRNYLGIPGIEVAEGKSPGIEVEEGKSLKFEVKEKVSGLKNNQWLLVDKDSHAMAAWVEQISPALGKKLAVNRVHVYNQASRAQFPCQLTEDKSQLKSTMGDTVLTYFFIVKTELL